MDFDAIEPWVDDVIASSFENWPQDLRRHALNQPLETITISDGDMRSILSQNMSYRRFLNLSRAEPLPGYSVGRQMAGDGFPKIGPVSWKEMSAFVSIPLAKASEFIPTMLRSVTDRMAFILHAFVYRQASTRLHIFPFVDLGAAFEARFRIEDGAPVHARWMKRQDRLSPPPGSGERLSEFAAKVVEQAGIDCGLLDLVLLTQSEGDAINVLEVNPILENGLSGRLFSA